MIENADDALKPEVRAFLGRLDADEIALLDRSIDLMRHVASAGRVAKWLLIAAFGIVIGTAALGDAAVKIAHWLRAGHL